MGTEISKSGAEWRSSDSCARPAAADRRRTRIGNCVREGRTGPRTPIWLVSTESAREPDSAVAKRHQLAHVVTGVSASAKEVLGPASWGRGYLAVSSGTITDEMIREYIDEQEGEQVADDSRFPIDNA